MEAEQPEATGQSFPGEVEMIAFGPAGEAFRLAIEEHLVAAGAVRTDTEVSVRLSGRGRYQAVHIPVWVSTRVELERLYAVLVDHPDVKFRL